MVEAMYVVMVYDVGTRRVAKMLKLCRQYLCWIQNSVFEGEITEVKLKELTFRMEAIIDKSQDSVIIFSGRVGMTMDKRILGKERMPTDNFL